MECYGASGRLIARDGKQMRGIYTFMMIRTLEVDSVRWRVGNLCNEHHEHGRHGEQGARAAAMVRACYIPPATHQLRAVQKSLSRAANGVRKN